MFVFVLSLRLLLHTHRHTLPITTCMYVILFASKPLFFEPRTDFRKGVLDPHNNYFVYSDTSDCGPDQAARRRLLRAALHDVGNVLYIDQNCLIHQYHLVVKESLILIDSFLEQVRNWRVDVGCDGGVSGACPKYFASMAKLIHFWRDKLALFIDTWETFHGTVSYSSSTDSESPISYRRAPLTVVGGRWGSVDSAERFLLERGKARLKPVLAAMLSKHIKSSKTRPPSSKPDDGPISTELDLRDDLDGRQAYQIKMSKYIAGAHDAIHSDMFWLLLRVAHCARGPLRHFFLWVQKYSQRRMLFRLVTQKADEILREFDQLYNSLDQWFGKALEEANTNLPNHIVTMVRMLAAKLVIRGAGGFETRVRAMTKTIPAFVQVTILVCIYGFDSFTAQNVRSCVSPEPFPLCKFENEMI